MYAYTHLDSNAVGAVGDSESNGAQRSLLLCSISLYLSIHTYISIIRMYAYTHLDGDAVGAVSDCESNGAQRSFLLCSMYPSIYSYTYRTYNSMYVC